MTKCDYSYRSLMRAIVQQSILDYVNSLIDIYKKGYVRSDCLYIKKHKQFKMVEDCEKFFSSPTFVLYSDLDGNYVKRKCREFAKNNNDEYVSNSIYVI